ncbi:hypothetical protein L7F22_053803 [Adiantum nelumboides]|nr:hypothetical protein [Adiantum nelumboides]
MACKLLAHNASVSPTSTDYLARCQLQLSCVCSRHLRSVNTISCVSSSSSLRNWKLCLPGNVARNSRSCDACSADGRGKAEPFGLIREVEVCDRSRVKQLEAKIYHGLAPCHHGLPFFRDSHQEPCVDCPSKVRYKGGGINLCKCSLWNPLKRGFSMEETDGSQRSRDRQRAFFSLCARAMVASHMVQSPVLSFLWAYWPSMVKELSAEGQGGGKTRLMHWGPLGNRERGHLTWPYLAPWKLLLLGFTAGTAMSITLTSAVSVGVLLDLCFWLCLLCSVMCPAKCTAQAVLAVMSIAGVGVTACCKSFNIAVQENICVRFCQRFIAGFHGSRARGARLNLNGYPDPKAQILHFPISSLLSRSNRKSEVLESASMGKERSREAFSQLQKVLSMLVKL